MINRKFIIIGIIIILVIVAIALIGISLTGFSVKQNKETIKVGWIGGLTGDTASVGVENLRGVELAVDEINSNGGINGKSVELIVQDDQYNPQETISAYNSLTSNNVKFIITETYRGYMALAKNPNKDIILINSMDSTEEMSNLGQNSFAIGVYDESIGYAIADYLNNNNLTNIGLITDYDDPFPLLVKGALKRKYFGVTNDEDYSSKLNDFRSIITKLKNSPVLVLIGWDETGRIVKQAKELGYNGEIIGVDTFATENFRKNTGNNYEGLIFTFWNGSSKNPVFNKLIFNYNKKYNKNPDNDFYVSVGYDSASVFINSINGCSDENINCVKNGLLNTKDFPGASGNITIDKDHVTRSIKESMFKYENGKAVPLD